MSTQQITKEPKSLIQSKMQSSLSDQLQKCIMESHSYDTSMNTCLQKNAKSKDFLQDVSDIVNCGDMYALKRTCYYDNQQDYCPVQLAVTDETLKTYYKGNILLQVWDKKGDKKYEKSFIELIDLWKIMGQYLCYRPNSKDKDNQYFIVVDITNLFTIKIKEIKLDYQITHIAYFNNLILIGTQSFVYIVDLLDYQQKIQQAMSDHKNVNREFVIDQINKAQIHQIDLEYLNTLQNEKKSYILQSIFLINNKDIVLALETDDNQLDFSILQIERNQGNFSYMIYQMNEILKRQVKFDPIEKFDFAINDGRFYGITVRRSRNIDLYRDLMKVESPLVHASTVEQSFEFCNILLEKDGGARSIHTDQERFSYSLSQKSQFTDQTIFNRCINNINLYSSVIALNQNIMISHGKILSIYNIFKKQWENHFLQEHEIVTIFRNKSFDGKFEIGILLEDGTIKILETNDYISYENWTLSPKSEKMQGKIIKIMDDTEDNYMLFITQVKEKSYKFYAFVSKRLEEIQLNDLNLNQLAESQMFLPLLGTEDKFVICNQNQIEMKIIQISIKQDPKSQKITVTMSPFNNIKLVKALDFDIKQAYAVLTTDIEEMICFINKENLYIQEFKSREVYQFNANIIKLMFQDNNFLYCFVQDQKINRCIFSIIDIHGTMQTNDLADYNLYTLSLNEHNFIDYDKLNNRFVYFSAFGEIYITPPLHRNNFEFFGMNKSENYIKFKQVKDLVYGLDYNNVITTWSCVTGKKLASNKCSQDLHNYEVFTPEVYSKPFYSKVLLIKRFPKKNINESDFFERNGFQYISTLKNQVTFNQALKKEFYKFKLVEIQNSKQVTQYCKFIHPRMIGAEQYLYFNRSNNVMLEIVRGQLSTRALLYESNTKPNGYVEWKIIRQLDNFPQEFLENSLYPYYFSPEFTFYLDYDHSNKRFIIRHSATQIDIYQIPKDVIGDDEDMREKAKKVLFYEEDQLIVMEKNDFKQTLEKKVDINKDWQDISSCALPFMQINQKNYYTDMIIPGQLDVLVRLQNKYRQLRRAKYLQQMYKMEDIYERLFTLEVLDEGNQIAEKPFIDLSFTYLDWNVMEKLTNGQIQLNQISKNQLIQMLFNILPNCETALHKVFDQSEILSSLLQLSLSNDPENLIMDLPFIKNLDGMSPLHLCYQKGDLKCTNIIFKELSISHFNHHSLEIVDVIPYLLKNPTPDLLDYFDKRFSQTSWTQKQKRGALKLQQDEEYCMMASRQWVWNVDYNQQLITEGADLPILVEFFDVPEIHTFQGETHQEFFKYLTDCPNLEIFQKKSIRALIDFKFPLVREWTIRVLFFPYGLLLVTFCAYANTLGDSSSSNDAEIDLQDVGSIVLFIQILLMAISFYFLRIEFYKIMQSKKQYFTNFWNYFDIVPPTIIIFLVTLDIIFSAELSIEPPLYAIIALLMWLKFLYFFRLFKFTGYLIRMITQVIVDMAAFFTVFIIGLIGFGNAFLILSNFKTGDEEPFIDGFVHSIVYTYFISLGEFDYEVYGDQNWLLLWTLFILCTVLNLIVMLNLLISIIGDTFGRVLENADSFMYQVMSEIISDNNYLIPPYYKDLMCTPDSLLLFAQNISQDEQNDQQMQMFVDLKEMLEKQGEKLDIIIENQKNSGEISSPIRKRLIKMESRK